MKRLRGSGTHSSPMNRDNIRPRPNDRHGGSGMPKGRVHEAPTRGGAVNAANYGGQRAKRK
jgi:hypothetical protein